MDAKVEFPVPKVPCANDAVVKVVWLNVTTPGTVRSVNPKVNDASSTNPVVALVNTTGALDELTEKLAVPIPKVARLVTSGAVAVSSKKTAMICVPGETKLVVGENRNV